MLFKPVLTVYIAPGSPWGNGYVESFNGKLRNELLNQELLLHIDELRHVVDRWRMGYNHYRPHSRLGYMAFAKTSCDQGSGSRHLAQVNKTQCDILS